MQIKLNEIPIPVKQLNKQKYCVHTHFCYFPFLTIFKKKKKLFLRACFTYEMNVGWNKINTILEKKSKIIDWGANMSSISYV